jgi:16S rRNA pseudouridine516 synthase
VSQGPTSLRIDRLLANMGYGSRREIQQLARSGRITLGGVVVEDVEQRLPITADLQDRLAIDKAPLDPLPGLTLLLHKPLGVTCSHKETGGLVYELLPPRWRRRDPALSTVGRLDKETSGLLLFTDDGALLHRIISPRSHVSKRYLVTLDRPMTGQEGALFASGAMMLEGEARPLAPAALDVLSPTTGWLTITEGRYHQVRRMFAAAGNHVTALHRDRVGGLDLPGGLKPGRFEILNSAAVERIFQA